jgi:hypothetical protein
LVEDGHPERGRPAVCRHPAVDASFDRDPALNPALDRLPAFDRVTAGNPTFDGFETEHRQPPVKWLHAFNEFAQPRLLRPSARQHAVVPKPVDVESALRRRWAEEIEVERSRNQKVPSLTGPFFSVETL